MTPEALHELVLRINPNSREWVTVKSAAGYEECSQKESAIANDGHNPIRFLDWNTGTQTFHRGDRSTSGRQSQRGPRTIWLRKAKP